MKAIVFGIALGIAFWVCVSVTALQAVLISLLLNIAWEDLVTVQQVWFCLLAVCVLFFPVFLPKLWRCAEEQALKNAK